MAEEKKESVNESNEELLVTIRNELINGNFDEAIRLEGEHLISSHIMTSIANSVFDGFIRDKKFALAVSIGRKFSLSPEKIKDAVLMEFHKLMGQEKYEEAIEWGLETKLPDYEITRAAVKWMEVAIMEVDVKKALELRSDYSITQDQIGNIWQKGYDKAVEEEKYFDAALLSREFGASERKTLLTASKALKNSISKKAFSEIISVEKEFRFFHDSSFSLLGDDEAKSVVEAFLEFLDICLKNNDGKILVEVIDGIRILYSYYTNHHLKGLVDVILKKSVDIHGNLMKNNEYSEAQTIKEQLELYEEMVPMELKRQVLAQAVEFHNRILKKGDFETAKDVKDKYQIMGIYSSPKLIDSIQKAAIEYLSDCIKKGRLKRANFIIEDYNIPASDVKEIANEEMKYLLESEKYDVAFDALVKFEISTDDSELKGIAVKSFERSVKNGYYEIAAELGYTFGIRNPNVKKAAKIVWERLMDAQDYAKARIIKKKHKLTRKDTLEIAQKAYDMNMVKNNVDVAKKIRDDYGIGLGFFEWLIELIKSILRFFFKP